jgi:hypothetical protein
MRWLSCRLAFRRPRRPGVLSFPRLCEVYDDDRPDFCTAHGTSAGATQSLLKKRTTWGESGASSPWEDEDPTRVILPPHGAILIAFSAWQWWVLSGPQVRHLFSSKPA